METFINKHCINLTWRLSDSSSCCLMQSGIIVLSSLLVLRCPLLLGQLVSKPFFVNKSKLVLYLSKVPQYTAKNSNSAQLRPLVVLPLWPLSQRRKLKCCRARQVKSVRWRGSSRWHTGVPFKGQRLSPRESMPRTKLQLPELQVFKKSWTSKLLGNIT